ncbi:N-acetyltransferase family protein [Herbiconiux sp. P18]|uniref:GNAT family N-acetyltransferase n=1 Tax=Herbiconiux liangxiaofengii TaxID=3342795 RepID=UPI0035B8624A
MTDERIIRPATGDDGAACAAIYAHYVLETPITFETEPPSAEEMTARIAKASHRHAWLVLEEAGRVVGYAYGGTFHARAAYRWSCEVSVYLAADRRGTGGGRALYAQLLDMLRERGYRRAIAGVTQPNPASDRLHEHFGFEPVGVYREIGWKGGAWWDVAWSQLDLAPGADRAVAPDEIV